MIFTLGKEEGAHFLTEKRAQKKAQKVYKKAHYVIDFILSLCYNVKVKWETGLRVSKEEKRKEAIFPEKGRKTS